MPPSNAQLVLSRIQAWNARNPRAQIDPQAALAVATHEGLGGGVGDGGHAYGPFQLNNAGGVITGSHPGTNSSAIQQWAWSPAGIDYALSHIASVAGGLRGAQAVQSIVSRFERPADPSTEISRSLASLGLPASTATGYATQGPSGGGAMQNGALVNGAGGNTNALVALLLSRQFQPPQVDAAGTLANPAVHYEATPPTPPIDALSLARRFLDSTKGAFTNPGFAQYLHGLNGVSLPRSTVGQAAYGTHTSSPTAGDVAFFGSPPSHQAVMLDGSHMLHGTNGGTQLRISSLAHPSYASGLATVRSFR